MEKENFSGESILDITRTDFLPNIEENKQKNMEQELKEKLDCIISDSLSDIYGDRISTYRLGMITGIVYTRLQQIKQVVIEDVPHQYQERLLNLLD